MSVENGTPSMKAMTLTDAAAERVKQILAASGPEVIGIHVGVKNGGCAGMNYVLNLAKSVDALDEVVEDKGVRIVIDGKSLLFLIGTELDFQTDKMASKFVFNNPNQTAACGCGESVAIKPRAPESAHNN
ncbi:MAG: iron-sulfur cluster assembly accessory protein [Methylobacteriaceae bacterium]|jgi:iron-sulfur cluster assembly protein|nr:iron-sulfur cluster assembly accessory protein [Methylobacteriaceae bacterium]